MALFVLQLAPAALNLPATALNGALRWCCTLLAAHLWLNAARLALQAALGGLLSLYLLALYLLLWSRLRLAILIYLAALLRLCAVPLYGRALLLLGGGSRRRGAR